MRTVCVSAYLYGLVYGSFSFVFLIVLFLLNVFVPSYVCTNRMRNIYVHAMLNIMTPFKSQRLDVRTKQIKSKKKTEKRTRASECLCVCVCVCTTIVFGFNTYYPLMQIFHVLHSHMCIYYYSCVRFCFLIYGIRCSFHLWDFALKPKLILLSAHTHTLTHPNRTQHLYISLQYMIAYSMFQRRTKFMINGSKWDEKK